MSDSTSSSRPYAKIFRRFRRIGSGLDPIEAKAARAKIWQDFAAQVARDLPIHSAIDFVRMPFTLEDSAKAWRAFKAARAGSATTEGKEIARDLVKWRKAIMDQEVELQSRIHTLLAAVAHGSDEDVETVLMFLSEEHGVNASDMRGATTHEIEERARASATAASPLPHWIRTLTAPPDAFDPGEP